MNVSSKTRGKTSPPVQRSRHARARSPPHGGRPQRRPRSMPAARRGKLHSRRIVCRRCHPNMLLPRRPGAATTRLPAGSCLRFEVPPWRTPPCKLWEMRRSPTGRHRCPQVGRPRAEILLPSASLRSSPTSSRHRRSGRRRRRPACLRGARGVATRFPMASAGATGVGGRTRGTHNLAVALSRRGSAASRKRTSRANAAPLLCGRRAQQATGRHRRHRRKARPRAGASRHDVPPPPRRGSGRTTPAGCAHHAHLPRQSVGRWARHRQAQLQVRRPRVSPAQHMRHVT